MILSSLGCYPNGTKWSLMTCARLSVLLCDKIIELDFLDFKPGRRCFFMDPGVAAYYLNRVGTTEAAVNGTLNENYVFINLLKRQDFPEEITFEMPAFATWGKGELDFYTKSLISGKIYVIEVKAGKNSARTAMEVLEKGKADYLLMTKGNTHGGIAGQVYTIPVYGISKFQFL